jgi:caspase domain-containing protein/uncharacterized protein DUF1566
MNKNRLEILTIFLLMIFLLISIPVHAASRGLTVIGDMGHQSGKLGAYKALIIGINDYEDPKIPDLDTAVNDAKAMAELLRNRYGFQVELLLDRKATKEAIYRAMRNLASSTKSDDSVLIYYAGHGDLDRTYDDGWWIPADAKGGNPITYFDNVQVQKAMRSMNARHVLLISDSCYSGTLFGQARAMPPVIDDKYYLSLYNEKSRWGMTSGNKTPVSDRGSVGHSVFAYQLLKELRKNERPYISAQEIYTRIAPIVGNNSEQTPLCRPIRNTGDQGGEFVFVASTTSYTPKPVSQPDVDLPKESGASFDDLLKAEEEQRQAKGIWRDWQQAREKEYSKIREIDKSENLTPKQKTVAWQRFLAAASQDNPYSRQDDDMRSFSRSRISHWENEKSPKRETHAPPAGSIDASSEVTGRDGNFIAYATGVVYDKDTGLEWYTGPDRDTNWYDAKRWIDNLTIDGGGWRMPTRKELRTLYKKEKGYRNMTPVLNTSGWWVWSGGNKDSSSAWGFSFFYGFEKWGNHSFSKRSRGFAVRSRK